MQHRMLHLCSHHFSLIKSNFAIGSDFPKVNEDYLNCTVHCTIFSVQSSGIFMNQMLHNHDSQKTTYLYFHVDNRRWIRFQVQP